MGRMQTASGQRPRCGLKEDVFGCLTRAGSRLVQCSDRAVGTAAFAGGFSKCLIQLRPVQGMRCWLGSV